MDDSLKIKDADRVPINPKVKVSEIMKLPLKDKKNFVPPLGFKLKMGPYIYEVKVNNPSQLRFTASLYDIDIREKEPDVQLVNVGLFR